MRREFLKTLSEAIRLHNETSLGDAPIEALPEGFWGPDRSPAPGTLRRGSPVSKPPQSTG